MKKEKEPYIISSIIFTAIFNFFHEMFNPRTVLFVLFCFVFKKKDENSERYSLSNQDETKTGFFLSASFFFSLLLLNTTKKYHIQRFPWYMVYQFIWQVSGTWPLSSVHLVTTLTSWQPWLALPTGFSLFDQELMPSSTSEVLLSRNLTLELK